MGLRFIGSGIFVETSSEDVSKIVEKDLRGYNFYPYVQFHSLERASYGFILAPRPPNSLLGTKAMGSIDHEMVWSESIAPLVDFGDALEEFKEPIRHRYIFEEVPYAEIQNKEQYRQLLEGSEVPAGPKDWIPGKRKKSPDMSSWAGPGVYDLRENPPTRAYPSVERYELEAMEHEAGETLDFMFQGDEWKDLVKNMAERHPA